MSSFALLPAECYTQVSKKHPLRLTTFNIITYLHYGHEGCDNEKNHVYRLYLDLWHAVYFHSLLNSVGSNKLSRCYRLKDFIPLTVSALHSYSKCNEWNSAIMADFIPKSKAIRLNEVTLWICLSPLQFPESRKQGCIRDRFSSIHVHANLDVLQLHRCSFCHSHSNINLHFLCSPPTSIKNPILVQPLSYSCPQVNRGVGSKASASLWIKWRGERRASRGCRGGDEAVGLTRARHDDLPQCVSQLAWVTLMKAHTEPNTYLQINKVILTRVSSKIPSFVHRKSVPGLYCHKVYPLSILQISEI